MFIPQAQRRDTGAAALSDLDNNFNLLRLAFALMVAVYHVIVLPGVPEWAALERPTSVLAEIGVQGFFVLSGYLVFASLERSSSLRLYAEKRVRRLYPAYAATVIICALAALAIAPAAGEGLAGVAKYLGWNLVFLNFKAPELPGLFATNRFHEVNGALWTLKIEVMFYIVLPALAWLLRVAGRWRWGVVVLVYVGAEAWRLGLEAAGHSEIARQLPGQMSFFITGVAFRMARLDRRRLQMAGLIGAGLLVPSLFVSSFEPVRAAGLGAASILFATGWKRVFDAARFGDLSYGLYIVHFPIIQTTIAAGLFAGVPVVGMASSMLAAGAAALLMWRLVERPALRSDSAYKAHGHSVAAAPIT